ncbi:hypothetical protein ABVT39_018320 [Epinephelus coioides]
MAPFIRNKLLEKELAQYGHLVRQIKMIPLPYASDKSPHLKHVMFFRIFQVHMVLKKNEEKLNLVFKFRVDDFDHTVDVTSETMKCFGCGTEGHLIHSRAGERRSAVADVEPPPVVVDAAEVSLT